ncbi:hypothetical protein BOS5A_230751 [Bosea sp. EC-HK365B]|nr:hypothetical protein BOSE7B_50665 [Bosea sp. 7B]CAD5298464.1 hypothetical protein BOSE21B_90828 [Bosea sp. 21B]VVT61474.1 hypothetical protein BOS5A_230751 [Bosea sp. EC-HK365B]VXB13592.1 hypothetical protein BOSE127_100336 [Bosea sp. 127]
MLALVASIHVLNTGFGWWSEDVNGRDKPDHDGFPNPSTISPSGTFSPGSTFSSPRPLPANVSQRAPRGAGFRPR